MVDDPAALPFRGAVPYYVRGRLPYPASLAGTLAAALGLDGHGRLLDAGCGPGIVALRLAHLFDGVVGVDIDSDMLAEARRQADEQHVANARWIESRAEDLPRDLGPFRVATFGRSFHWMDHERLIPKVHELLEPGGAFVILFETGDAGSDSEASLPHPAPPGAAVEALIQRYIPRGERAAGHERRADMLRNVGPMLTRAGFAGPEHVRAAGGEPLVRNSDDVVAFYFSHSHSAPPLFGDRAAEFEAELRRLLSDASPSGLFSVRGRDALLSIWRKPGA